MVFRNLCDRNQYSKKSLVDSAAHVKDERIMIPLLAAKDKWEEKNIEKVSIKISSSGGIGFFLSGMYKDELAADLWIHKDFTKNNTIAILAHGFTDSSSGLAYLAEAYEKKGISTLSLNLRSHGESGGRFSGLGSFHTDGKDIASWVQYVRARFGKETRIILHGISMGGSSVIQAAYSFRLPVHLVVSDCTFSDYSSNVKRLVQSFFPKNIFSTFLINGIYLSSAIINFLVNGFFFGKNSPKYVLKKVTLSKNSLPLLLFHGENDTLVSVNCAKDLYDSYKGEKKIVVIPGAPHIGSWFYDKEKYMNEIIKYLLD